MSQSPDVTALSQATNPSAAELRRRRGYSLTDLAETCGLTEQEIARIEAGEEVDVPYLQRIAAALRIPVDSMQEYARLSA